jgi:hypothetical protein
MRIWIFLLSLGERSSNSASAKRSQCVAAEQSKLTISANNRRRLSARRAYQGRNKEGPGFRRLERGGSRNRTGAMLSVGYATQRYGTVGKCKPPDEFIPGGLGVANSRVLARALSDLQPFGMRTSFPSHAQALHWPSLAALTVSE